MSADQQKTGVVASGGYGRTAAVLFVFAGFAFATSAQAQTTWFVDDDGIFEADIEWLAAQGITKGCNPPDNDRFCPDNPVTRGQIAAFLVRALGHTDTAHGHLCVEDEASRAWMGERSRRRLLEGLGTPAAVQQASLRMLQARRADGQPTHPFYWAAFVASGDWR